MADGEIDIDDINIADMNPEEIRVGFIMFRYLLHYKLCEQKE